MTRRLNRICLLALLAAVLAATTAAQQAKPIANWVNLNQLVAGSEIRVTLATGKTMRGFVQRVTAESLAINATTSQEMLSRQERHGYAAQQRETDRPEGGVWTQNRSKRLSGRAESGGYRASWAVYE